MNKFYLMNIIFACFLYPFTSQAQELSIQELLELSLEELLQIRITTPSKRLETLDEAPSVVSLITAKEIEQFGANSLYEILERVTSVYMTGFHLFPQNNTSLRGDLASHVDNHILILINGRPLRESYSGGFNFSIYLSFPINVIEQIEVIRGPGSVLYGSNAYVGVINLITKKDAPTQAHLHMKTGSFGAHAVEAEGIVNHQDFKLVGGIKSFKERGWPFKAHIESGRQAEILYQEDNLGAYLWGTYQGFSLNALFLDSAQDTWFIPSDTGETRNKNERVLLDIGYEHSFSKQSKTQFNLTYNGHHTRITHPSSLEEGTHRQSYDTLLEWTHFLNQGRWNGLLGSTIYFSYGGPDEETLDHTTSYSLYTQGQYQFNASTRLFFGAQAIKPASTDWKIVPRGGVLYHLNSQWGIKFLYSYAFRTAFQEETLINASPVLEGNRNLKPETVQTWDASLFYHTKTHQFSFSYFNSQQQDLIIKVPKFASNITNTFANQGEIHSHGVELETKLKPTEHLFLTSSLTYQTNRNQAGRKNYTSVPNWMIKTGISYELDQGTSIGLFDNFFSHAHDVSARFPKVKILNPEPEAFHLMTLNFNLNLKPWIKVPLLFNAYIYNLLDEEIYAPEFARSRINSIPARQGRGIYVGLEYDID